MAVAAAHVLVFPFPLQGHVNSMLKLAELLSHAGLHITFLNSEHNHRLLANNYGAYQWLACGPAFRFRSITDGLEDDIDRSISQVVNLTDLMHAETAAPFKVLLLELCHGGGDKWPALTCIIVDGIITFPADIANELGIPAMFFCTYSIWSSRPPPELVHGHVTLT